MNFCGQNLFFAVLGSEVFHAERKIDKNLSSQAYAHVFLTNLAADCVKNYLFAQTYKYCFKENNVI